MNLWTVFSVCICSLGYSNGVYLDQISNVELKNTEDPSEDVDASRVLMNDGLPTIFDNFLETFKFKKERKNDDCSETTPEAAASETKEVEVTDEDWLTTMVKDFDKFITALGEDGDLELEEGTAASGSKVNYMKNAVKESEDSKRISRGVKKLDKNSGGHKMAIQLGNRLRSRRNIIGTNKAGLVFIPNKGKSQTGTNRAEVVPLKAKREIKKSMVPYAAQQIMGNNKIELIRKQREVNNLIGTNKAGLVFLPKQDKSKAGSNRVEVVGDELSNGNQNILSRLINKRNTMKKQDPQFSLIHRRQITVQTDNPNLIKAIEKEVIPTSGNQVHSISSHKSAESSHNSEQHAPSLPFLSGTSNSEKESPVSNLSSKIPGFPNNIIPSGDGGNTPTAVIGGFSMMLMPMPGMTLSNMQNMFQSAQQFSQLLPALPSLPS